MHLASMGLFDSNYDNKLKKPRIVRDEENKTIAENSRRILEHNLMNDRKPKVVSDIAYRTSRSLRRKLNIDNPQRSNGSSLSP